MSEQISPIAVSSDEFKKHITARMMEMLVNRDDRIFGALPAGTKSSDVPRACVEATILLTNMHISGRLFAAETDGVVFDDDFFATAILQRLPGVKSE